MKRTILNILCLTLVSFLLAWLWHFAFTDRSKSDLQWQFVAAAKRGDFESMVRYFGQGARIDGCPTSHGGAVSGYPALFEATESVQPRIIEWLLAHGADPNQRTSDSCLLDIAEGRVIDATMAVDILKKHGAKSRNP